MTTRLSNWDFIRRALCHHWRINTAMGLGVTAAVAVLTGALLVGDCVRGSLRALTLDRLGNIDALLVTHRFFGHELADKLRKAKGFSPRFRDVVPAIVFRSGTVEKSTGSKVSRASGVLVVGSDPSFWDLGTTGVRPRQLPAEGEIVLNKPLAEDLGATIGEEVVLRLPKANAIPADSPLGTKEGRVRGIPRLKVVEIIPAQGLGRFSLSASQSLPRNAYVSLSTLQGPLEQKGQVNALLVAGDPARSPPDLEACRDLDKLLRPSLSDMGLSVERVWLSFGPRDAAAEEDAASETVFDYFNVTSDRMVMDEATARVLRDALSGERAQPVFTYLANEISRLGGDGDKEAAHGFPYSTITAVDSIGEIGPLLDDRAQPMEPLADDQIVLNSWAAEDLQAQPGDTIRVIYFEPESTHGSTVETHADFILKAVAPLTEPAEPFDEDRPQPFDRRPTLVNDRHLTPEVRGITDQDSISRWDVPFELTRTVRRKDDDYYSNHRLTPKAFVSRATGQRLWGSRFGQITSFRIPAPHDLKWEDTDDYVNQLSQKILDEVRRGESNLGFTFTPIKAQGLGSSDGTTPFDVLFLALSFFIIASALMLVSLLFRLGVERRGAEVGLLLAVGLRRGKTARLLAAEGALVAAIGALAGIAVGAGYAWLMITGLRTVWLGAIVTPFLHIHFTARSLVLGYVLGVLICVLTIAWSIRLLKRVSAKDLLAGRASHPPQLVGRSRPAAKIIAAVTLGMAAVLLVAATRLGGEAQAGAFVGGGALVLTGLLIVIWERLRYGGRASMLGTIPLAQMAIRSAGRNPGRSAMTIGLMALATFLIVALSSFRLDPTSAGTGGFNIVGKSSEAVFADLNTEAGRDDVLGERAGVLSDSDVLSLRVNPGDDASCNNLYKANRPRVLGVTPAMIRYFDAPNVQGFSWAASAANTTDQRTNPWRLLQSTHADDSIPVVIDKNTAMYGLGLYGGIGQQFSYVFENDVPVVFRVVGLLSNSILQGNLLIGESDFERHFRDVSGYRYFLIRSPTGKADQIANVLEDALGDEGFDASSSIELLENLLAVQNTYLSTFQSMGALGLLLGTFGLAAVQLRNVLERRSELALLRAVGFRRRRLAQMVILETAVLLLGGLGVGVLAALLAVLPHMVFGSASIPFRDLTIMLVVVLAVGMITSLAAVRATLQAPLLSALRGD